jgi:protein farnesyltransferase/geranylgeranyltransferase type-1 subunit alpha
MTEAPQPYIKFGDREAYKDLSPVLQDDGPFPVCPIAYSEQFVDTMNYFRAIVRKDERSQRALDITTEAIDLNPANYSVWYYRRLILTSLKSDYRKELEYVTEQAIDKPKNYQIWYHRQVIVELLGDPSKELEFTAEILSDDAKNYHAWAHRQWVIRKYNLWDKELEYTEKLLTDDIKNNSAWNQRYFVVSHFGLTPQSRKEEIEYTISKINASPQNESSWNYLLGIVKGAKFSDFPIIEDFCLAKKNEWKRSAQVLSTLIEIYEESQKPEKLLEAIGYCESLAKGLDDIHKKYWIWRKKELENLLKQCK